MSELIEVSKFFNKRKLKVYFEVFISFFRVRGEEFSIKNYNFEIKIIKK